MGGAYAELITDNRLLMLQVHALSASDVTEIADAMRRGLARVTDCARTRSGADAAQIQRFIAFGQLCHLVTTLDIDAAQGQWASSRVRGRLHRSRLPPAEDVCVAPLTQRLPDPLSRIRTIPRRTARRDHRRSRRVGPVGAALPHLRARQG